MLKILLAVLLFGILFLFAIIAIAALVLKKGLSFFRRSYHRPYHRSSSGWKYSKYGHHHYGHKHYRRKHFSGSGFFSS